MRRPLQRLVEAGRVTTGPLASQALDGPNGCFILQGPKGPLLIIASDGLGWEHASARPLHEPRTPTWEEMCFVKDAFWRPDEAVVQFHPPEAEYVNCHSHVLHLWRPLDGVFPRPPSILVGPRVAQVTP